MLAFEVWWFEHKEQVRRVVLALVLVGIIGALGAFGWAWAARKKTLPVSTETTLALEARRRGDYALAMKLVEEGLKNASVREPWDQVRREMQADLRVDFRLEYLPRQRGRAVSGGAGLRLSAEDPYYFLVTPSDRCFLYLFHLHSTGELEQVFPNQKNSSARNQIPPGRQRIPSGAEWLRVPPQPGTEQVMLVAARWEMPELESLAARVAAEKSPGKRRQEAERFLARIGIEDRSASGLPGLVYGSERFVNASAQAGPRNGTEVVSQPR